MTDTLLQAIKDGRITLDQAREQFRPPTMGERIEGAAKIGYRAGTSALLQGNAMLMELESKALGAMGLDEVGKKFGLAAESMGKGRMMGAAMDAIGEPPPQTQNDTGLGKTLFQDLPMVGGSMLGMSSVPGLKGAKAGVMSRGALVGGAQGYWEARAAGADDTKSWASFVGNAALGLTEAGLPGLPKTAQMRLGEILARADKASGGGLKKLMWEGVKTGFSETVQEGFQQVGSNAIANVLYDDDRKLIEGLLPTMRGSFLAGLLTGGLAAGAGGSAPSKATDAPVRGVRVPMESLGAEEQAAVKDFTAGTGARVQPVSVGEHPIRDFVERRGARVVFVESEDGSPLSHPASYNKDGSVVVVDVNAGDALPSLVDHEVGHHVLDNVEGARERIQAALGPELQAQALEDYRRDLVAVRVKEAGRDLTPEELAQIEQETMPNPDEGIARLAEDFSPVIRLLRTNPEAFSKVQDVGFWRGLLNAVLDVGRSMIGSPSSKERAVAQLYRSVARRGVAATVTPEEGVQIARSLTAFLDEAVGMQQKASAEQESVARGDDMPPEATFPNTGEVTPRGDDSAVDPALGQFRESERGDDTPPNPLLEQFRAQYHPNRGDDTPPESGLARFKDRLPTPDGSPFVRDQPTNERGRQLLSMSEADLRKELDYRQQYEDLLLREQHPTRDEPWYQRVADLRRQARDPQNPEGDRAALQLKRAGIQPSGANVEEIADALRAKETLARTPKGRFGAESKAQAQNVGMGPKYAVAYHGSPHDFDEFKIDRIGSGEGNQSYGHGLYFADNKQVANYYRSSLSDFKSKDVMAITKALPTVYKGSSDNARRIIDEVGRALSDGDIESPADYLKVFDVEDVLRPAYERAIKAYEQRSRLYQVDLAPSEDEYLLWDEPISKQSDKVRKAIDDLGIPYDEDQKGGGGGVYQDFVRFLADQDEVGGADNYTQEASRLMRKAGIRGIKYLDGTSRRAGKGTYNYVIFDDKDVKVLAKYAVRRQTETPEFKAWFGDSKVVDENGKPLVVYHGTTKDFNVFDFGKSDALVPKVWFSDNPNTADTYATGGADSSGANIKPLYVSLKNPRVYRDWTEYSQESDQSIIAKGHDGALVPSLTGDELIGFAFRPEQIKSATGNRGTFNPTDPDIRHAVARTPSNLPKQDDSRWARTRAYVQNDLESLRRVVEGARPSGKVTDANDPYLAESLRNSRARTRVQDDQAKYVEPVLKAIADSGISVDDAEAYLLARAAPARNAMVEIRTLGKNTAGSGMTDAQAAKITAAAQSGPNAAGYNAIATAFDALTKRTRQHWVDYGLESAATVKDMETQQPAYAPFRSDPGSDGVKRGPGRQIKGREFKVALGRGSMAENPIAYATEDLQRAIMRGETNRARQVLYQFVKDIGDTGFAFVDVPPMKDALVGGQIRKVPDFQEAENEITAKVGGALRRVRFTDDYAPIARALKGADRESLPDNVRRVIEPITKAPVAFSTRWNPLFPPVNLARDVAGATLNEQSLKIVSPAALKRSFDEIHNNGPWYQRFRQAGGPVAFMDIQRTTEQVAADFKADVEKLTTGKDPRAWPKRTWAKYAQVVEGINDKVEAMTRLSGFRYAVEELNYSDAKAALFAKDLTTNFERRGQAAWINTLYAFSNAGIQSTDKFVRSMKKPGAKKMALALAGAAYALSVMNRYAGGDDDDGVPFYDKIDPYTRQSNAILMNPWSKGDYFKIPLPFMWGWFHVLGDQMATGAHTGDYGKAASAIGDAADNMFNPLGASPTFNQLVAPTALDPFVQMSENKTFTGSPLYPERFGDKTKPDSELTWDNTNQYLVEITKWLNKASGGTSTKSGAVDVSAISVEHLVRSYFGGTGGEVTRGIETIRKVATGEDTTFNEWPLARRFMGEIALKDMRRVFIDHTRMVDQAVKDEKAGNPFDQRLYRMRLRERAWKDRIGDLEDAVKASDSVAEREKLRGKIRALMIEGVRAIKETQR